MVGLGDDVGTRWGKGVVVGVCRSEGIEKAGRSSDPI
jgi:hypothetical protein